MQSVRADLFRLLGDEDRLRLLALCAEEELTVGELAQLLGESQPQITKKSQPLREVGLLAARRDGTRTLLKSEVNGHDQARANNPHGANTSDASDSATSSGRAASDANDGAKPSRGSAAPDAKSSGRDANELNDGAKPGRGASAAHDASDGAKPGRGAHDANDDAKPGRSATSNDPRGGSGRDRGSHDADRVRDPDPAAAVIRAALAEGRRLCAKDGSLAKVARIVAQREELSRHLFEQPRADVPTAALDVSSLAAWLPIFAPLLPGRALAIDAGTGEGELLPLLSPLYDRVVAIDRSAARLARCAARIAAWDLPNVRLREGSIEDATLAEDIAQRGGADLVVIARVLHHVGRPQDVIASATQLLCGGGHLAIVDYLPHDDEALREQGHVWLGFEPDKLRGWLAASHLTTIVVEPLPGPHQPPMQLAIGTKPARS